MDALEQQQKKWGTTALGIGLVAGVAAVVGGGLSDASAFYQAYLIGFLMWLSVALGCLIMLMIHHLTGGAWLFIVRRPIEAGARTLPLFALLFLPILFGLQHLYPWAVPELVAEDKYLQFKAPYLNVTFFTVRAVLYFAIWIGLGWWLSSWSYRQDDTKEPLLNKPQRMVSGIGIVLYGIAATFASFDWIMSLDPHWFSSIYGPKFMVAHGLAALSVLLIFLVRSMRFAPYSEMVTQDRLHDLGKWQFALVVLWAYMMLAQFIIIWSGNLPEHIAWYLRRTGDTWKIIAATLTLLHFVVPFVVLLSRLTKQKAPWLFAVAVGLLLLRPLDLFWMIGPELHHGELHVSWLDGALPVAIGGLWVFFWLKVLRAHPQRVQHDPRFEHITASAGDHHG
jgi:hypothetical protein